MFKVTESYRPGAEGREKTEHLIRTLYALLRDLSSIDAGAPELVRNTDITSELKRLAESANFQWITDASDRLAGWNAECDGVRSLSLDAFAAALEKR